MHEEEGAPTQLDRKRECTAGVAGIRLTWQVEALLLYCLMPYANLTTPLSVLDQRPLTAAMVRCVDPSRAVLFDPLGALLTRSHPRVAQGSAPCAVVLLPLLLLLLCAPSPAQSGGFGGFSNWTNASDWSWYAARRSSN